MTTLTIIATLTALWGAIELSAWGASEAASEENRRVAIGRGVVMVFVVVGLCLWSVSASAATVQLDPGDAGLVWTEEGFRPVDGIQVREGKHPCPRVGPSWKNMATDQVIRERRCPLPPDAGWRWAEPLDIKHAPVVYAPPRTVPPVRVYPPGCCGGGGHVPPPERPPEPLAPVGLPGSIWALLAALSGLTLITRGRRT